MSKINEEISKDEPYLEEKDVGKKEFIVKQNIQIQVQYKIIADDKPGIVSQIEKKNDEVELDLTLLSKGDTVLYYCGIHYPTMSKEIIVS